MRPLVVLLEPHWALGRWGGGLGFGAGGEGAVLATGGDEDGSPRTRGYKEGPTCRLGRCQVGTHRGGGPAWTDAAGCGDAPFQVRVDANLPQICARNESGRMWDG